jgi:uncharacterized repeat protein (TIGR03803 family)
MDKGLKQRDLLYVSNANETVNVYRYWQRTLAGVLTDFKQPMGACADSAGDVYCRETGNSVGCGTVFSLKPNGTETVLHSFGKAGDGIAPAAGLIDVGGRLYGTTLGGGSNNLGTVFAINL